MLFSQIFLVYETEVSKSHIRKLRTNHVKSPITFPRADRLWRRHS